MADFWRKAWPWLAMAVVVGFVGLCHRDYGVTWDESVQHIYGKLTLKYFLSGGEDRTAERFVDLRYYGPLVETVLVALSGADWREWGDRRHFWLGLLAAPIVIALAIYARGFACWQAGAYGTLCLWMMPAFVGHVHNNSKDVPFAVAVAMYMASLLSLLRAPALRWTHTLAFALALGALLCTRPGGIGIAAAYGLSGVLLARGLGLGWSSRPAGKLIPAAIKLSIAIAVAWLIMVASWPWTHADPFSRPLQGMRYAIAFPRIHQVLFEGANLRSDSLPWYYLPKYICITTPPAILALALFGVVAQFWRVREKSRDHHLTWLLAAVWFLLPVVLFMTLRPNTYDGVRHFTFILAAMALLAGLGAVSLARGLTALAPRLGRLNGVFALALCMTPVGDLVALHPYQSSYFNGFVGGLPGAFGRYPLDYWGSSLRESVLWINARTASTHTSSRPATVLLGVPSTYANGAATAYAAPHVSVVAMPNLPLLAPEGMAFDYYLAPVRYGMEARFADSPIVFAVTREGVPFSVVRQLHGMRVGYRRQGKDPQRNDTTHGSSR